MPVMWFVGIVAIVGFFVHYGMRRAIAAMICLGGAAFTYVGIAPNQPDRALSLATGLICLMVGITILRCNYLWLKNSKTILEIVHTAGIKAAIQAQLRYVASEFIPHKISEG